MSSTKTTQFSIPITLQNLPPAETLNQMIDNLNYLCSVMDEAFDSISSKIKTERGMISDLKSRITKCDELTKLISKYPNKATKVLSYNSFPEKNINKKDQPLVEMTQQVQNIKRPLYRLSNEKRIEKPPQTDTLKLFHSLTVKTTIRDNDKEVGLGPLPDWVTSINDCLLFNTDTNPYVKYSSAVDNLMGQEGKIEEVKEQSTIFAQPKTIATKMALTGLGDGFDLTYKPGLENAPQFKMQRNLSSLGGIAFDENWEQDQISGTLAPSGVQFNQLPTLGTYNTINISEDLQNVSQFNNIKRTREENLQRKKLNQQQQQQQQQQQNQKKKSSKKSKKSKKKPPQKKAPEPKKPQRKAAAPIKKKPGGGGRGALLDAIRMGTRLKKRSERKERPESKPKAPVKMGLMDMLKMKLQARNQLMRGITDDNKPKNEFAPPKAKEVNQIDFRSKLKSKRGGDRKNSNGLSNDNTGLGLGNLPKSITQLNLDVDDVDPPSGGDDNDWGDDE